MMRELSDHELMKIKLLDKIMSAYSLAELEKIADDNEVLSRIRNDYTESTHFADMYGELRRLMVVVEKQSYEHAELLDIIRELTGILSSENPLSYNLQHIASRALIDRQ